MNRIILITFIVLLLAGCQSASPPAATGPAPTPSAEVRLEGSEWILTSLQGRPPINGSLITLEFKDGVAGGTAGCNGYGGNYQLVDGELKIEEIASTLMACLEPEGVMEQEQAYLKVLSDATSSAPARLQLAADSLEILNAQGQPVLTFVRKGQFSMDPAALVGTAWRLENIDGRKPAREMTLVFNNEAEYSGFAGCRHFFGSYTAEGDDLGFWSTAMLGSDCAASEALNIAESDYTTLLSTTTDYRLEPERLVLLQSSGKTISFSPLAPVDPGNLGGTSWELVGIVMPGTEGAAGSRMAEPLWPGTQVTAEFSAAQISGSAGCNDYFAAYTVDGRSIRIESPGATKKLCTDPEGLMRQEGLFLEILSKAQLVERFPGQLWISTGDGHSLFFIPAKN